MVGVHDVTCIHIPRRKLPYSSVHSMKYLICSFYARLFFLFFFVVFYLAFIYTGKLSVTLVFIVPPVVQLDFFI